MRLLTGVVGPRATMVATTLGELGRDGLVEVVTADDPSAWPSEATPAFVIATGEQPLNWDCSAYDIVLDAADTDGVIAATTALWRTRLATFAMNAAEHRFASWVGGPTLEPWQALWDSAARRLLRRLQSATVELRGQAEFCWDHIGSTSVDGLAAKPIIDLQLGVPSLDDTGDLSVAVAAAGFVDVAPLAADSPGVLCDRPLGRDRRDDVQWAKRLFASADPGQLAILHVRETGCPWWHYTIRFRELLRSDPGLRIAYEQTKTRLAELHRDDVNYDAYTRAKAEFFDGIQDRLEQDRETAEHAPQQ